MKKQLGNRIISWLLALGMIMSPTGAGLTAVPVFAEESGIVESVEEDNITTDENVSDEEETTSPEDNDTITDENNPTEDVLPSEGDNIAEETQSLDENTEGDSETYSVAVTVNDVSLGTAYAEPNEAVEAGTEVTLTYSESENGKFVGWDITPDTVIITDNKFTMPEENVTVEATFAEHSYVFTVVSLTEVIGEADTWEEAVTFITDKDAPYDVYVNKDYEFDEDFELPTTAEYIAFEGGMEHNTLTFTSEKIVIPVNTSINCHVKVKNNTGLIDIDVAKDVKISFDYQAQQFVNKLEGTPTSKCAGGVIVNSISTFGKVNHDHNYDNHIYVNGGTVTNIGELGSNLTIKGENATAVIKEITYRGAAVHIEKNADGTIPKVTIDNIFTNDFGTHKGLVIDITENGETVEIPSGTTVVYSPNDISKNTKILNTTASGIQSTAYYYPKTKEIKAENPDAVSLSKNGDLAESFQNLDAAFAAVTDKTADYTIEINDDLEIENLVIPKTANSITFTGDGRITMANKKLAIPVNTTFDVYLTASNYILGEEIHKFVPDIAVTVAAGKKLTVNKEWLYYVNTITGTKTSELVLNAGASFDDVKNFGTVTAVDLSLWNNMSGIGNFSGNLTSKGGLKTITIDNISANSDIHIWNSNTKLTVNSIAENAVLTLTVDEDAALASGTTVLYSKNNISPNVKIANKTADGDELSAYYYTKTKSIKAEVGTALTLSYGNFEKSYPNFELLFADVTDNTVDYTITLNTDMFVEKLTFPKTAKSITINGAQLGFDNKTVAIPVDMTIATERFAWSIGEITEELPAGQGYTMTVAAGKTLTINSNVCDVKAITGTKTSNLNIIGDGTASVYDLKTFENVTTAPSAWLCVSGSMSAVSNFSGRLIFSPTIKSKDVAISNIAADSLIQAWIYDNQKHKITVNAIAENATLTYRAWVNDLTSDLANGTTILYAPKDITEQIVIENKTESGKSLKPFYYKKTKEIKAEVAEAITLSDGTTENNYPNLEKAFENITDSTKNYTITLYEDVKSEKLTLPKTAASITIRSDNLSIINVGKLTSITANTDLTIENIAFETSGKTLTINAKKNLTVDGLYGNVTALKGGAKFALNWLGEDEGLFADITGFGTVNVYGALRAGKTFNTTNLVFKSATATLVISDAAAKVSVKAIDAASGGIIKYAEGAKTALAFTGKDAAFTGTLTITGAVANGQAVLTAKGISLDKLANGITPANVNVEYGFTQVGNNICYMGKVIALNSDNSTEKYALWSEVVAVIEKAKNAKADYEITLLDNYNFNGAIKLPKAGTYKSITIDGANLYELTFTGNIALTGNLNIENTTTVCTTKTGAESPFKINAGKYSLTLTEVITGACTISGSTGSVITLNDVKINGSVSGDTVICNGTDMVYIAGNLAAKKSLVANDSIFIRGNINAYALSSTSANGADFEFSHGKKITIGKGGITAGELSFRVVDSDFHLDAIEDGEVIGTIAGAISSNASVEVYGADDFEGTLKAVKGKLVVKIAEGDKQIEAIRKQALKILAPFVPDKDVGEPNSIVYSYYGIYGGAASPHSYECFRCTYDKNGYLLKEENVYYSISLGIWNGNIIEYTPYSSKMYSKLADGTYVACSSDLFSSGLDFWYNDIKNTTITKSSDIYEVDCGYNVFKIYTKNDIIYKIENNYGEYTEALEYDDVQQKWVYLNDNVTPYQIGLPDGIDESIFDIEDKIVKIFDDCDEFFNYIDNN